MVSEENVTFASSFLNVGPFQCLYDHPVGHFISSVHDLRPRETTDPFKLLFAWRLATGSLIDLDMKLFFLFGANDVTLGTVKWFNPTKGYGFIAPDDSGKDVFVHISAVEKAGYTSLVEGAKVSYELVTNRSGKQAAENLRLG
ncbi:cold shock CspA family protein [Bradyrhizobium sp. cir1]|nr:cold shock CspA family protein [Bradyrhizobium sp. cir1]